MKTIQSALTLSTVTLIALLALTGCGPGTQKETGFLSDYSKLEKESSHSLKYVNMDILKQYSRFIIDPTEDRISNQEKGKQKLTEEQIKDLKGYLNAKIIEAVKASGKTIAYRSAPNVARLRIAITDLDKSAAISMVPQASLLGAGVGGASIEAELIDSVSGQQLAAIIESRQGSKIPLTNLGDWTAAKQAMDQWAKNLQKRLEAIK